MTTLSDIVGSTTLVELLRDYVVEPIINNAPDASKRVILYGPPATGKTFVAKAVAGELGLEFKKISPSDDAENIKNTLESASPETLVFIDEIDKVNQQLLVDALNKTAEDALVVGGTNRPWSIQNLLREGFSNTIFTPDLGLEARKELLRRSLGEALDLDRLTELTDGYLASDLKHVCEQALSEGPATQESIESTITQYTASRLEDWISEAKANKEDLDSTAFAALHKWLDEK